MLDYFLYKNYSDKREKYKMNHFIEALESSLDTQNWYSVLFISLTLPDICGKIDEPNETSKKRTINWFNKYLKPIYTSNIGADHREHIFLSGSDFYALRCAYLHEGSDDITSQNAQDILEKFKFIQPITSNICIHRNQSNTTLQLQVDKFGKEILDALRKWTIDISKDPEKLSKIDRLLRIEMIDLSKGFSFN